MYSEVHIYWIVRQDICEKLTAEHAARSVFRGRDDANRFRVPQIRICPPQWVYVLYRTHFHERHLLI